MSGLILKKDQPQNRQHIKGQDQNEYFIFYSSQKCEVAFIYDHSTLRQVLETMEFHKYASIPMLNKAGEYVGTMTEGDLLWGIKKYTHLNVKEAETTFYSELPAKG